MRFTLPASYSETSGSSQGGFVLEQGLRVGGTRQRRSLIWWEALHDNGWTTVIAEQADGSFTAWLVKGDRSRLTYSAGRLAHAHAAALAALHRIDGHRCSARCFDWTLQLRARSAGAFS